MRVISTTVKLESIYTALPDQRTRLLLVIRTGEHTVVCRHLSLVISCELAIYSPKQSAYLQQLTPAGGTLCPQKGR